MSGTRLRPVSGPTFGERLDPTVTREQRRLPRFHGLSRDPGPRLAELRAALVGVGSIGTNIALHLARLGAGKLALVDPGRFKPESCLTHPVLPDVVGRPKASAVGQLVHRIAPGSEVLVHDGPFAGLQPADLLGFDCVLLASDNLRVEVEVGQACAHLGLPLFQASVHGETLLAQVRTFSNQGDLGPCPACLYGEWEWRELNRRTRFRCDGGGAASAGGQGAQDDRPEPTMSTSFLCSLAADLLVTRLLRWRLDLGDPVLDRLVDHAGFSHASHESPLENDPGCPLDHASWEVRPIQRDLTSASPVELLGAAGVEGQGLEHLAVTVHGHAFVDLKQCACGASVGLRRFQPGDQPLGRCPDCRAELRPGLLERHAELPVELLDGLQGRPLADLGARAVRSVLVRRGDRSLLLVSGDSGSAAPG